MKVDIDYFIQITFVLLILSMINEKITNFIRYQFPDNKMKRFLNPPIKLSEFATTDDYTEVQKKKKSREIQTLATVTGVLLAFTSRANLFQIYNPDFKLGWQDINWATEYGWGEGVSDFFGCLLTGMFLSLGSKFFHDLLDLLLESKNLKRKLNDRESINNLHTTDEFDKYIAEVEPVVVEKSIGDYLNTVPQVLRYEYSEIDEAADVYLGEISAEDRDKLKRFITVNLANKKSKSVELNYFEI